MFAGKKEKSQRFVGVRNYEVACGERIISAVAKGHGITAKAQWVAVLMLARLLNSPLTMTHDTKDYP
jgi:hypothetical protein